jgi:hypothetical protein
MLHSNIHKGLSNEVGENNCFLNVTIQALWHVEAFKLSLKSILSKSELYMLNDESLLGVLCNLFIQYEFADLKILPPSQLRELLGKLSAKFKLGEIADANEALDTILNRIHTERVHFCPDVDKCLSHKVFGASFLEQSICKTCLASSEPNLRDDFLLYFNVNDIINQSEILFEIEKEKLENFDNSNNKNSILGINIKDNFLNKFVNNKSIDDIYIEFGKILKNCRVFETSCPSLEEGENNNKIKIKNNSNNNNSNLYSTGVKCNAKATMQFYSLETPLALALSIGYHYY